MATSKDFLNKQATHYRKHQQIANTAKATLDHQYQIQARGTIPTKYKPKPLKVINTDNNKTKFTHKFMSEYKRLFTKSLEEAITQNSVTFELEKSRCLDVLRQRKSNSVLHQNPQQFSQICMKTF